MEGWHGVNRNRIFDEPISYHKQCTVYSTQSTVQTINHQSLFLYNPKNEIFRRLDRILYMKSILILLLSKKYNFLYIILAKITDDDIRLFYPHRSKFEIYIVLCSEIPSDIGTMLQTFIGGHIEPSKYSQP